MIRNPVFKIRHFNLKVGKLVHELTKIEMQESYKHLLVFLKGTVKTVTEISADSIIASSCDTCGDDRTAMSVYLKLV